MRERGRERGREREGEREGRERERERERESVCMCVVYVCADEKSTDAAHTCPPTSPPIR